MRRRPTHEKNKRTPVTHTLIPLLLTTIIAGCANQNIPIRDESTAPASQAQEAEMKDNTEAFADNDNVIYEICNESNSGTSWESIRAYAEEDLSEAGQWIKDYFNKM